MLTSATVTLLMVAAVVITPSCAVILFPSSVLAAPAGKAATAAVAPSLVPSFEATAVTINASVPNPNAS